MIQKRVRIAILVLVIAALACNVSAQEDEPPIIFPTPVVLFPSVTPSIDDTPLPSVPPTQTPTPSPTPRIWPPPFFGSPGPTPVTPVPSPYPLLVSQESINFLLIGTDRLSTSSFRTDTLIILHIQPQNNLVTLISIPRDLYVYIPGWTMQRVNTAYQHGEAINYPGGGTELLKDTILYNLGIRIDHIALVDFDGFRQIIDTMGGIDIPTVCAYTDWHIVDPDESAEDEDNWELFTVGPGVVHMDGDLALWYARSRLKSSDFDRGRRQQELLRAIYDRSLQLDVLTRLPDLYNETREAFITDLSLEDLLTFAPLFAHLEAPRIRSYYINNSLVTGWRTPQGASVLLPKADAILAMLKEATSPPDDSEQERLKTVVEIWNGTNNDQWDILAAERLHYGGFETQIQLADNRNYSRTLLHDFTEEQDPNVRNQILLILGLSENNLVNEPNSSSRVSYRLILGSDYQPCFNPAKISR